MSHNSKGIKWNDYKDEIVELMSEGLGSRRILAALEDKHGEFESKNTLRQIQRLMKRWGDDVPSMLKEECKEAGINPKDVNYFWYKSEKFSINANGSSGETWEDVRDEFIGEMQSHAPKYETYFRSKPLDGHCLVVDIADLHIGKLALDEETGDAYSIKKAKQRALEGVEGLLNKSQGFDIDKILFVAGNDVLHVDSPRNTTTKGTFQEVEGTWHKNFKIARKLYVDIIERLLAVADVHFVHVMSNHDYASGFMLADAIQCWFHNCENITFDTTASHRKYWRYGNSLIGMSHGDSGRVDDMPLVMANEAKEDWSKSEHRYIYLHHIHHHKKLKFQSGKDYHGCEVTYLRSPSGTDSWHHQNQYQHAPKAVEGFIHSKKNGKIAQLTHIFK